MLKICGNTICKTSESTFKQGLATNVFLPEWKKGNIVPCYKKGNKKNVKITAQSRYFLSGEKF